VLTVEDFGEVLAFYRDVLGLEQVADWSSAAGQVVALDTGRARLELFDRAQAEVVDTVQAGRRVSGPVRASGLPGGTMVDGRGLPGSEPQRALLPRLPAGYHLTRLRRPAQRRRCHNDAHLTTWLSQRRRYRRPAGPRRRPAPAAATTRAAHSSARRCHPRARRDRPAAAGTADHHHVAAHPATVAFLLAGGSVIFRRC